MSALSIRQRAREQITAEILEAARTRLGIQGPNELSLRAVARDVGMVSSAIYRYFANRDELLTALLLLAYDELADAAETADASVTRRQDCRQRWLATCHAIRDWSHAHRGDYALLYGSPVPGYAAPNETISSATRVPLTLAKIVHDAQIHETGTSDPTEADATPSTHDIISPAREYIAAAGLHGAHISSERVMRVLMAWTTLYGTISFELFGHLVGSTHDYRGFFDGIAARIADDLGLHDGL